MQYSNDRRNRPVRLTLAAMAVWVVIASLASFAPADTAATKPQPRQADPDDQVAAEIVADAPPAQHNADGEAAKPDHADAPDWFEIPEVLVTATRSETELFAAPHTAYVVGMHDFRTNRMYRTTTEALSDVPGVMVQKTSNAQGSPYIRGFTGFRNVMLVDGIRLNNSIFRDGPNQYWNLIDPYTIERLEVVKGPASVLYGSDAIGGAVNAILRRPEANGQVGWYREVFGRVSTAERSYVGRGEINATDGGTLAVLFGGTVRDYGNVDGGGGVGPQDWTGYEVCSGDVRFEYRPGPDTTWTFGHYQLYENDAWRTHKTTHGMSWEGTTKGNELRRIIDEGHTLTYLRYNRRNLGAFVDAVELTGSVQTLRETRFRTRTRGRQDHQGLDVTTYGLGMQFESPSEIGHWTYGMEWYHDEVDSFNRKYNADGTFSSEIQGPVGDNARYDLLGAYVQNELPLAQRVSLLLGGRYTYAGADANQVEDPDSGQRISLDEDWDSLVGSARLSWFVDPQERWNIFGGVSQGFRAPNLSDLTRLDTARSNEIETPSPGLDPEHFLSYEAGVKARYKNFVAQAAWFWTEIEDMIVRTPTGDIVSGNREVTKRNAGDGFVQGVELSAKYRFHPQWTVFGQLAWTYGEVDTFPTSAPVERREPISRLMPPTGQLGLRWDCPNDKLWAEVLVTAAGDADNLSTSDVADTQRIPPGGTPGYVSVGLRGGYKVTEDLDIWAALENVTNEDYRIHGSGVNEPGINFIAGLRWRF
jgi:hemoglobin/transferrin/lactoferrin receptor protein